jgi:hypothetical protein
MSSLGNRLAMATVVLALATSTCRPRALVEQAVRARGGSIRWASMEVEARVHRGFPGTWRSYRTFSSPDRYAWTIVTTGEPLHYLFDGGAVRAFVGDVLTGEDPSADAPLRSQARFVALMLLADVSAAGARVEGVAASALPPGVRAGITVTFPDGDPYVVLFDERLLPVQVEGSVDLAPVGRGRLVARQSDFRPVAGRWLPHHVVYGLDGVLLADERVVAACAGGESLPDETFRRPTSLPACRPDDPTLGAPINGGGHPHAELAAPVPRARAATASTLSQKRESNPHSKPGHAISGAPHGGGALAVRLLYTSEKGEA